MFILQTCKRCWKYGGGIRDYKVTYLKPIKLLKSLRRWEKCYEKDEALNYILFIRVKWTMGVGRVCFIATLYAAAKVLPRPPTSNRLVCQCQFCRVWFYISISPPFTNTTMEKHNCAVFNPYLPYLSYTEQNKVLQME